MKKITLLRFFALLSSKIESCLLPKNKIATVGLQTADLFYLSSQTQNSALRKGDFHDSDSKTGFNRKFFSVGYLLMFLVVSFFGISSVSAQNLPSSSSCTSKDLELVEATLPGAGCGNCDPGVKIRRTLNLTINNKTGSVRTAFAFWGTLKIFNPNGTEKSKQKISGCSGTISPSGINTLPFMINELSLTEGKIEYICGERILLTDMFLAWSTSSKKDDCISIMNNSATINPKCGTLPEIDVFTGLDAIFTTTQIGCNGGSGTIVSNVGGGKANYTLTWQKDNTDYAAGNATLSTPPYTQTLSGLEAGSYVLTIKDANGCEKTKTAVVIDPAPAPLGVPILSVVNNCDDTSTITAKDAADVVISPAQLTWSNQATTNPIIVSDLNAITATRTVNGCISGVSNSVTPAPKTTPAAPSLGKTDNCDGTSTITATSLASGATLTWSDGGTGNPRTVSTTASLTVTQTVSGCTSAASNSVTPAPKTTPAAPSLGKTDNCDGTSTITATSLESGATLTWSDGGSGNPRTVSTTTSLTVTQTVSGCTSAASNSVTPAPKTTPAAPSLGKTDNCDGTSTITATSLVSGATLTWSDGGSGNPRTVSTTTSLTVTQTVSGCTSAASNSVTPAPKTTPAAPSLGKTDNCDGTSTITATALASGATLTWSDGGSGNPRTVSTTTSLTVTQAVSGCTSAASNSVTPAPKTTPAAPSLGKTDNCDGTSTITATALVSGATLTWSDGGSGNPRTVSTAASLNVTQTVSGCISAASNSVTPAPKTTPAAPSLIITQPSLCGLEKGRIEICNPIVGSTYTLFGGDSIIAEVNMPVIFSGLSAGSNPSITVTTAGCTSQAANCSNAVTDCPSPSGKTVNPDTKTTSKIIPLETIPVETASKTAAPGFDAYPVPFKDQLTIKYNFDYKSDVKIELFNAQGISVLSKTDANGYMNKEITLDLKLNKGKEQVYVVKLTTDQGTFTKKVMSSK